MAANGFAAEGPRYAVATPHVAATQAAVDAFAAGGTAVDAAVAANAVLTVVYPHMCGIGGDLFAIVSDGKGSRVINGSGAAAQALSAAEVRREYEAMPVHGAMSVSVPGTIAAWSDLLRVYGRLPLGAALRPAFGFAQDGVPLAGSVARAIVKHRERLEADSGMRAVFLPGGRPLAEQDPLRQPALAETLRAIADDGPEAFYDGPVGERLVSGLRMMGSPLTPDDFRLHATEIVAPLMRQYRGLNVLVPPPNSQGFVLETILGCIQQGDVDPDHLGDEAPLMARLFPLASNDRDTLLADTRRATVPIDEILSAKHAADLLNEARRGVAPRSAGRAASGDTVGVVAADASGLWVSINQSLYDAFGSGILEPETGIIAHNRGSYFSLDERSPNVLEGGKRPAHTLMPVMVRRNGAPLIASATMGGSAHAQIHTELLTAVIDQHRDPVEAMERPRWLVGGLQRDGGSGVVAESRVPDAVVADMRRSGITVELLKAWDEQVGHAQLIVRDGDGFRAASDPRADGAAACG